KLLLLIRQVAPLLFRDSFLRAQPVAVLRRFIPLHLVDRAIPCWSVVLPPVGVGIKVLVVALLVEALELVHRHLLGGDGKRAAAPPPVLPFDPVLGLFCPAGLGGRRAHEELHRAGDDHHGLPLTRHVPPRTPLARLLRQLLDDGCQPLLALRLRLVPQPLL